MSTNFSTQFDTQELLESPKFYQKYRVSPVTESSGLHLIHKLVLLTAQHPEAMSKIQELIEDPQILNQRTHEGWTPLMIAARNSKTVSTEKTVQILLDAGADINRQDNTGFSALNLASRNSKTTSSEETVRMLIDAGADLNLQNNEGWTALMHASRYSKTDSTEETVRMLIDTGADLNLQNKDGWTALTMAIQNPSSEKTVQMLLDAGSKFTDTTQYQKCSGGGTLKIKKLLLKHHIGSSLDLIFAIISSNLELFTYYNHLITGSVEDPQEV